ncbi:MAG: hypothetical protein ACKO4T_13165 [Planctomycetaceae bacterium]
MKRLAMVLAVLAAVGTGAAQAQQSAPPRPQSTRSYPQATRSYRSYSVSPSTSAANAQRARGAADATWRHADAKAQGQFHGGR